MARLNATCLRLFGTSIGLVALALPWLVGAAEGSEAKAAAVAAQELERALALGPNIANGLKIYRACAECHQPEGWGLPDGSYPQLAGQHRRGGIKQRADQAFGRLCQ